MKKNDYPGDSVTTPGGTRTHNLWIRSPTPYPLGHRGWWDARLTQGRNLHSFLRFDLINVGYWKWTLRFWFLPSLLSSLHHLHTKWKKNFKGLSKIWNASRICVSSLRRGHANLLCIVPILVYVTEVTLLPSATLPYILAHLSSNKQFCLMDQVRYHYHPSY